MRSLPNLARFCWIWWDFTRSDEISTRSGRDLGWSDEISPNNCWKMLRVVEIFLGFTVKLGELSFKEENPSTSPLKSISKVWNPPLTSECLRSVVNGSVSVGRSDPMGGWTPLVILYLKSCGWAKSALYLIIKLIYNIYLLIYYYLHFIDF